MKKSVLAQIKERSFKQSLAIAITTGLLAGAYMPGSFAAEQSKTDFATAITGVESTDKEYADGGVLEGGKYSFTKDSNVVLGKDQGPAVDVKKALEIAADGKKLQFSASGADEAAALKNIGANSLKITGKRLSFAAESDGAGAKALHFENVSKEKQSVATINGDVDLKAKGTGYVIGAYVKGNSELTINGKVNIGKVNLRKNGKSEWGVDNGGTSMSYPYSHFSTSGLYAGSDYGINKGGKITVNGDVSLAVNGTGIMANGGGSQVNVNGGGAIVTNKDSNETHYVIVADSGVVSINMNDAQNGAGDKQLVVRGNLLVDDSSASPNEGFKDSIINIGLKDYGAKLNGVVINSVEAEGHKGAVNMYVDGGGIWTNEFYGYKDPSSDFKGSYVTNFVGGPDLKHKGTIVQRDENPLTIENFSGYAAVYYGRSDMGTETSHYIGGDTIIKHAAKDSNIIIATPRVYTQDVPWYDKDGEDGYSGILSSPNLVGQILNAVAGKLVYEDAKNGAEDLNATAWISSGMTESSVAVESGKITFDKETGRGQHLFDVVYDFNTDLNGRVPMDLEYNAAKVIDKDGNFVFDGKSDVNINGRIRAVESFDLNTNGKNLNINFINEETGSSGIKLDNSEFSITQPMRVKVDAPKTNINIKTLGGATGIEVRNNDYSKKSNLTINGDVKMDIQSMGGLGTNMEVSGINVRNNSTLDVNGNVVIKSDDSENPWGLVSTGHAHPGLSSTVGIKAERFNMDAESGLININGNVDLAISGSGIVTYGDGTEINVKGGSVVVDNKYAYYKDESRTDYAKVFSLASRGGTINMNVEKTEAGMTAGSNKVNLTGNIGVLGGKSYANGDTDLAESVINLGLTTEDSTLVGLVQNNTSKDLKQDGVNDNETNGQVNMWLQNGAVWTNTDHGNINLSYAKEFDGSDVTKLTGGSTKAKAGYIFQKDGRVLNIGKYSGNNVLVYAHTNDGSEASHFAAGDTHIKSAELGSGIIVSTDNNGINLKNEALVQKVLNNLAGKLYYDAYVDNERNLSGKVQIASGLTGSSISKLVGGDIAFDEGTGKGSYVPGPIIPEHQTETDFTQTLTGIENLDAKYVAAGIVKDNGDYVFEKDSNITIAGSEAALDAKNNVVIKAEGSNIHFVTNAEDDAAYAIKGTAGKDINITADRTVVNAISTSGRADGIHMENGNMTVNGALNVTAKGNGAIGIYANKGTQTFNGDVKVDVDGKGGGWGYYGASGLYATSQMNDSKGAEIIVNGKVDLSGNGNGIFANSGGSKVTVQGGVIKVAQNDKGYSAIRAEDGTVNMNIKVDESGQILGGSGNDVDIIGNVVAGTGAANENDKHGTKTAINLALDTEKSKLHGLILNEFPTEGVQKGDLTFTGETNLWLQNGATWINEDAANAGSQAKNGAAGSFVSNFVGGSSADKMGVIEQRDGSKLTLDKYAGHTMVVYEHSNNGAKADDYAAGDIVINKAQKDSSVTLSTKSNCINLQDKSEVENVLNALAGKLTYSDAANNGENLTGKVQIGEGLTSSSRYAEIEFKNEANGKGSLLDGSVHIGNGTKPGEISLGDYETLMMYGARAAMVDSMVAWRDSSVDSFVRANELHGGAEEGAWGRINHGKVKYEGAGTEIDGSYNSVQTGFDREMGYGWKAGLIFDYRDGDSNYKMGSEGENKLYSIGMYGSKDLGNGSYFDVAAKMGKVENDFTARNEVGQELKGEYSAATYSLSAQYGKRIENGNGTYLEPQLQLTYSHVNSDNYDTHSGKQVMNVDQGAFDSLVGRVGLMTGTETERGGWFAKLSVAHEFAGDIDGLYLADDGGLKNTQFNAGDTWSELSLGGNYRLSQCSNFYADLTKTLSGDYKQDWKVNAGLSFSF